MNYPNHFIAATNAIGGFGNHVPAPYFRRTFEVHENLTNAQLIIGTPNFYELYVSGCNITKGPLAPCISNPDQLIYYDTYDVREQLTAGRNVLAVQLGNGFGNNEGGMIWDFHLASFRSAPKFALRLTLTYADGSQEIIETDEQFLTAESELRYDDYRAGEIWDLRLAMPGWTEADFDDSTWKPALEATAPKGKPLLCDFDPIICEKEIHPIAVTRARLRPCSHLRSSLPLYPLPPEELEEGWLFDFGENNAGIVCMTIQGKPGQHITIQFGESLNEEGELDQYNMAFLPDSYNHRCEITLKGDGVETWAPKFSYYGFRYCLVHGITEEQATPELFTYHVLHSDLAPRATFECSNEVINQLFAMCRRSDLANFFYFPTDCPQREKNGWTGDAALSAEHMLLTLEVEKSLRAWLRQVRETQLASGMLPGIVPTSGWGYEWGNGPAWDQVIFEIPYRIWQFRGHKEAIEENADAMVRYLHYIAGRRDEDGLLAVGLGDWCPVYTETSLRFTDSVVTYTIAKKAVKMLSAIGRDEDAVYAQQLMDELYAAIRTHLINTKACCPVEITQTTLAMAIEAELFTEEEMPKAVNHLVEKIHADNDCFDVGILGGRTIFRALERYGYVDLALKLMLRDDARSYGQWVSWGATTLFESFGDKPMSCNSQDHHFWGDIAAWFIQVLAGIRINPDFTDTSHVEIQPRFASSIDHCSAKVKNHGGEVSCSWKRDGSRILLTLDVPEGVYGELHADNGWHLENGAVSAPIASGEWVLIQG